MTKKKDEQLTIAVDLDGVIADYDGWNDGAIGAPRPDVVAVLRILRQEGWRVIVYSCRATAEINKYLVENSIPFDDINQNSQQPTGGVKPLATVYWDDRAYQYSGNGLKDIECIRNFRTWSGRR